MHILFTQVCVLPYGISIIMSLQSFIMLGDITFQKQDKQCKKHSFPFVINN